MIVLTNLKSLILDIDSKMVNNISKTDLLIDYNLATDARNKQTSASGNSIPVFGVKL